MRRPCLLLELPPPPQHVCCLLGVPKQYLHQRCSGCGGLKRTLSKNFVFRSAMGLFFSPYVVFESAIPSAYAPTLSGRGLSITSGGYARRIR